MFLLFVFGYFFAPIARAHINQVRRVLISSELRLSSLRVEVVDNRLRDALRSTPNRVDLNAFRATQPASDTWYGHNSRGVKPELIIALAFLAQAVAIAALLWQRTKRKKSEKDLVWRLQFESLISYFSSTFINVREEELGTSIEQSIDLLGRFLELDRISLFQFSTARPEMSLIISWKNDDAVPAPVVLDTRKLPWWKEQLLRGEASVISDVELLPPEAALEQAFFRRSGILSAASIPLRIGGQVNGAITFVSASRTVSWKPDFVSQLQVVGDILWNALQRKRAVDMLRESEQRFRLVANTAPVMIWMSGEDRLCSYVNEPWLEFTGRSIEQELGEGWTESVHSEDLQRCLAMYANAFDERTAFQMEYRVKRYDGEYRWISDYGVPRFNADGSFAGYIGSCTDVTERKKAEEALSTISRRLIQAQEQERTWIARELHDDINQRIALLSASFGALIRSIPELDTRAKEKAEELRASMIALGSDIQALSHHLHSSKLEYLGLVSACSSFCKEIASRHNVEVCFQSDEIPKSLPEGIGLCLFRVLQEALQNAVKHSSVSKFSVALTLHHCCLELRVQDSGIGFNSESTTNSHGLGLTSMKERLKLVDGELLIESKPQGGTTISARVPVYRTAKSAG